MTGRAAPSARRTSCLLLLLLGLVVALVVGLMLPRINRALDSLDPSLAPYDAALALALESALAPGRLPPTEASPGYEGLEYVVLDDDLSPEEFARRLRSVPGWDVIVVIAPYGSGKDIDLDAAGVQGFFLQRRVRGLEGWQNDGIFDVSVIRNGQVVSGFYVYGGAGWGSHAIHR